MRQYRVFQIPVLAGTRKEVLESVMQVARGPHAGLVATINTEFLQIAAQNEEFRRAVADSAINTIDGCGVAWLIRHYTGDYVEYYPGVDMAVDIVRASVILGMRVGLLGGAPGAARGTCMKLKAMCPKADLWVAPAIVVGRDPEAPASFIQEVRSAAPQILLVALGAPKQELWIQRNLSRCGAKLGVGVGGTFDLLSGRVSRAPVWIQQWKLEWLYRTVAQPSRAARLARLPSVLMAAEALHLSGRTPVSRSLCYWKEVTQCGSD